MNLNRSCGTCGQEIVLQARGPRFPPDTRFICGLCSEAKRRASMPLETADIIAERAELERRIEPLDRRMQALKSELGPLWRRSKKLREELIRRSYLVVCPKCSAPAETVCRDLRPGHDTDKKWPHQERLDAFAEGVGVDAGLGIDWLSGRA